MVTVSLVRAGMPNRPGILLHGGKPDFITVHETGNNAAGADAEMHRRFVHAGGGEENVSFHYVVDDRQAFQLLPTTERAWHAGDGANGPGNARSLAIECCVNEDGDWHQMALRAITLASVLAWVHGVPVGRVVQHNYWTGKNCPAWMRGTGIWDWFIARVDAGIRALQVEGL